MRTAHTTGRAAGFTLVQVLIGVLVMGIALIPASSVFLSSSRNVERSAALLEATVAAQTLMDRARDEGFLHANLGKTVSLPNATYPGLALPAHFQTKYAGKAAVRVALAANHDDVNLREVEVTVSWTEDGFPRKTSLVTYRANMNDIRYRQID